MSRRYPTHQKLKHSVTCVFCGVVFLAASPRRTVCDDETCLRAQNAKHKRDSYHRRRAAAQQEEGA